MSGIINKVKDAVTHHGDKSNDTAHHQTGTTGTTGTTHNSNAYDSNTSSNHGPHGSNVANAADPRVDSDRSAYNTASTGHSTVQPHSGAGMTGAGMTGASHNVHDSSRSSNHGPHGSNMANAADPRVDSDRSTYPTTSTGHSTVQPHSGAGLTGAGMTGAGMTGAGMTGASHNVHDSSRSSNHGPHGSNVANAADPRVDSDRSAYNTSTHHSSAPLATGTGAGMTGAGTGMTGAGTGMTGAGMAGPHHDINDSSRSSNYGPHGSNMANAADPRVDSDRSAAHHTSTGHHTGAPVAAGAGMAGAGAAAAQHNSHRSANYGPHDSNMANAADPRIDSDRSAHHTSTGHHTGVPVAAGTGMAGAGAAAAQHNSHRSSNYGPHDSNVANTADPRIDSQHASTGGVSNPSTHSYATGPASSTAGPHKNNLANKADPRVDSDLSKQNTHSSSVGNAGVIPISAGGENTTTKTFEQAQETSGAAGSSYNHGSAHHGSAHHGSAHTGTAGPHNSSVGNKVDPRVDSDLDHSATLGSQRI